MRAGLAIAILLLASSGCVRAPLVGSRQSDGRADRRALGDRAGEVAGAPLVHFPLLVVASR